MMPSSETIAPPRNHHRTRLTGGQVPRGEYGQKVCDRIKAGCMAKRSLVLCHSRASSVGLGTRQIMRATPQASNLTAVPFLTIGLQVTDWCLRCAQRDLCMISACIWHGTPGPFPSLFTSLSLRGGRCDGRDACKSQHTAWRDEHVLLNASRPLHPQGVLHILFSRHECACFLDRFL